MGAEYLGDGRARFLVWAPWARQADVALEYPDERLVELKSTRFGYHVGEAGDVYPGSRYRYRLHKDGQDPARWPDPASRSQPDGVHGSSEVVAADFPWTDGHWHGVPLSRYVLYELHVGTFTAEGTFDAAIPYLDHLRDLGITAVELMPVAQFPGDRNWGYDGVYPYAAQNSYGGPDGFRRLVDACHERGMSVVLDVVYNHLGPEGNYLWQYGPYFTDHYKTPWGEAVNFDGPHSDHVRRYFIESALHWMRVCHVDALRIDAVHAILDFSARPFLMELENAVRRLGEETNRRLYLIAESPLNDTRIVDRQNVGGFGLDAQWNDDFHHCVHSLLTGERDGYYADFGDLDDMARAFRDGFVYGDRYSPFRKRRHGNDSSHLHGGRLVVFAQNHDQIGNRMKGDRLGRLVTFEPRKLAAALVLLSPYIPLVFMGEEYGEIAPFPYFVSHTDPDLVEAVREGRNREFAPFRRQGEPPDPQSPETFESARLDHGLRRSGRHRILLDYYRELIRMRSEVGPLGCSDKRNMEVAVYGEGRVIAVLNRNSVEEVLALFHFGGATRKIRVEVPEGDWERILDSSENRWDGPGTQTPGTMRSSGQQELELSPHSVLVLFRERPDPDIY